MNNRIFAGGLPWEAGDTDLTTAFTHFGPVKDSKVVMDRDTGKSRGFGFVTFETDEDAASAVAAETVEMDVGGRKRTVRIQAANERPQRSSGGPPRDGRSNSGGGGGGAPQNDDRFEDKSGGKGRSKTKGSRKGSRGGDGGGYDDGGGYHSF
jgi:cold-inducible RNA-binding protein